MTQFKTKQYKSPRYATAPIKSFVTYFFKEVSHKFFKSSSLFRKNTLSNSEIISKKLSTAFLSQPWFDEAEQEMSVLRNREEFKKCEYLISIVLCNKSKELSWKTIELSCYVDSSAFTQPVFIDKIQLADDLNTEAQVQPVMAACLQNLVQSFAQLNKSLESCNFYIANTSYNDFMLAAAYRDVLFEISSKELQGQDFELCVGLDADPSDKRLLKTSVYFNEIKDVGAEFAFAKMFDSDTKKYTHWLLYKSVKSLFWEKLSEVDLSDNILTGDISPIVTVIQDTFNP